MRGTWQASWALMAIGRTSEKEGEVSGGPLGLGRPLPAHPGSAVLGRYVCR